jgi:hypothetical protein
MLHAIIDNYLTVSINQALNFLDCVYNEHVDQILAGSIQPVIEWLKRDRKSC